MPADRVSDPSTRDGSAGVDHARLVVLSGPTVGRRIRVDREVCIGRSPEAELVADAPEVSRMHARIARLASGDYAIEDLGSANGTFVNGLRIQAQTKLTLGDRVGVGGVMMLLFTSYDPLEEQLLQRQRLEALGRMTAGVVHDFNNMLGALSANIEFMSDLDDAELAAGEARESLSDMRKAAKRATSLARRLLSFSRAESTGHGIVDVSRLCTEIVQLLRPTLPAATKLKSAVEPSLAVGGDAAELHQVIMNLCINARDAMPKGGKITLSAERMEKTDGSQWVAVEVRDEGAGMDRETRARMFEPFFTTKKAAGGVGLGLATVQEIVTVHGGELEVKSELGEGTTIRVLLTRHAKSGSDSTTKDERVGPADETWSRRTILLVDDEAVFRRSVSRILRRVGMTVVEAANGEDAVVAYGTAVPKPDAVLLDLDLPGWTGEEVLDRILRIDEGACVLCISGQHDKDRVQNVLRGGAVSFLQKPVSIDELLHEIDSAIEAEAATLANTETYRAADLRPDARRQFKTKKS